MNEEQLEELEKLLDTIRHAQIKPIPDCVQSLLTRTSNTLEDMLNVNELLLHNATVMSACRLNCKDELDEPTPNFRVVQQEAQRAHQAQRRIEYLTKLKGQLNG